MHPKNNDSQESAPPQKKESVLARMQRRGGLVIQPKRPGELDVLAKLREASQYVPQSNEPQGEKQS
jgi:hypothetical protein